MSEDETRLLVRVLQICLTFNFSFHSVLRPSPFNIYLLCSDDEYLGRLLHTGFHNSTSLLHRAPCLPSPPTGKEAKSCLDLPPSLHTVPSLSVSALSDPKPPPQIECCTAFDLTISPESTWPKLIHHRHLSQASSLLRTRPYASTHPGIVADPVSARSMRNGLLLHHSAYHHHGCLPEIKGSQLLA